MFQLTKELIAAIKARITDDRLAPAGVFESSGCYECSGACDFCCTLSCGESCTYSCGGTCDSTCAGTSTGSDDSGW